MNTNRPIRRALVSVYNKHGIETLAEAFKHQGTEVVSTGSTARKLGELGVNVTKVEKVTGFPESLGGRVKTLDPHIHAGILADMTNSSHAAELEHLGIKPFDMVVVNLYPFTDTVCSGASEAEIIEKIDIGGPSMIRAAAKNSASVAVITNPQDYQLAAKRVESGQGFTLEERRWLAAKAFATTAAYDATIAEWTSRHWFKPDTISQVSSDENSDNNTISASTDAKATAPDDNSQFRLPSPVLGSEPIRCATARTHTSRPAFTPTHWTMTDLPMPNSSTASQ